MTLSDGPIRSLSQNGLKNPVQEVLKQTSAPATGCGGSRLFARRHEACQDAVCVSDRPKFVSIPDYAYYMCECASVPFEQLMTHVE